MADGRVGTHEAKTHLSEYINRVRYRGERILIERHGKPAARW
jgi:prevent-host-death family protein